MIRHYRAYWLFPAFLLCTQAQAQPSPKTTAGAKSVYVRINELAAQSRGGNAAATTELTHQLFSNVGIPTEIADSFGLTNRIVTAEVEFRNGTHAPVNEAGVVQAVNNLASTIGAPAWACTNQTEVRRLRMHMLVGYTQLVAAQQPPDATGHYKPLREGMRPMEAAFVAATLVYQKLNNADYQFTDAERTQNATLDAAVVKAKHVERSRTLQGLLRGSTVSLRDLLPASDRFFSDLGIAPVTNAGALLLGGGR